ncbi:hypothetical protein CSUI_010358 [Cystoisospora suis]|uniref:Transmembrane protein n=1 Tax=Cystoisospora suis TaxID=483139 RepID=A0A2C6KFE1_9APIC|nr:hypothetical protein CSUI_010358 [Cystoisospora suis]
MSVVGGAEVVIACPVWAPTNHAAAKASPHGRVQTRWTSSLVVFQQIFFSGFSGIFSLGGKRRGRLCSEESFAYPKQIRFAPSNDRLSTVQFRRYLKMKNGRLVVVFASVGCFLLVPLLLWAQLAVSSGDSAGQPSFFPSDKDGQNDTRQEVEKDVFWEEGPGVSVGRGQRRSGAGSPTTAEGPRHYDSSAKRQRWSSSRSWIRWHLSRSGSRSRPYRSMPKLLAAATSMTAAIFLLWRLWNAVLVCLEQNRNTSRSAGTTPRLLGNSGGPADPFAGCVKVQMSSLSGEDAVVDMAGGAGLLGEDTVDAAGEGNPADEDDMETAKAMKANDGGESGGLVAQNRWRRGLLAGLSFIPRVASVALIACGLIAFLVLQIQRYITDPQDLGGVTVAKDVITFTLLSGAVLGAFSDFFLSGRRTRGTNSDASTSGRTSLMQKRFIDFLFKFFVPTLTILAAHNDNTAGPWVLSVVALLVVIYSVGAPVQSLIARRRERRRTADLRDI